MEKKNKPRVFLSHSSKDKIFIERLYNDLQKYKIEPWKDTEEIRDGRPWLRVIFEDGIPTCDSILVYLTENSINSKMVKKEIDAAFMEQLSDSGIMILPYVADSQLRTKLSPDIRTLQCREWNEMNYEELLPSVIAEIWQSYVERVVNTVTIKEKYEKKNLEEKYKKLIAKTHASPFTKSQEKDFEYIKTLLSENILVTIRATLPEDHSENEWRALLKQAKTDEIYSCTFLDLIYKYVNDGHDVYFQQKFHSFINQLLPKTLFKTKEKGEKKEIYEIKPNFIARLRITGLTKNSSDGIDSFSTKMYNFIRWLGYNKFTNPKIEFKFLEKQEYQLSSDRKK